MEVKISKLLQKHHKNALMMFGLKSIQVIADLSHGTKLNTLSPELLNIQPNLLKKNDFSMNKEKLILKITTEEKPKEKREKDSKLKELLLKQKEKMFENTLN